MFTFYFATSTFSVYSAYEQNDVINELFIDEEFAQLHELLGQSGPGWDATGSADTPEAMTFMNDLVAARELLCDAYAFEVDNCANW